LGVRNRDDVLNIEKCSGGNVLGTRRCARIDRKGTQRRARLAVYANLFAIDAKDTSIRGARERSEREPITIELVILARLKGKNKTLDARVLDDVISQAGSVSWTRKESLCRLLEFVVVYTENSGHCRKCEVILRNSQLRVGKIHPPVAWASNVDTLVVVVGKCHAVWDACEVCLYSEKLRVQISAGRIVPIVLGVVRRCR